MAEDKIMQHLVNIATNGRHVQEEETAAVHRLLGANPKNPRQPSHQGDDPVQFLAGLTRAELRKQDRG